MTITETNYGIQCSLREDSTLTIKRENGSSITLTKREAVALYRFIQGTDGVEQQLYRAELPLFDAMEMPLEEVGR